MTRFCLYKKCEGNSLVYECLFEAFRFVFSAVGGAMTKQVLNEWKNRQPLLTILRRQDPGSAGPRSSSSLRRSAQNSPGALMRRQAGGRRGRVLSRKNARALFFV